MHWEDKFSAFVSVGQVVAEVCAVEKWRIAYHTPGEPHSEQLLYKTLFLEMSYHFDSLEITLHDSDILLHYIK